MARAVLPAEQRGALVGGGVGAAFDLGAALCGVAVGRRSLSRVRARLTGLPTAADGAGLVSGPILGGAVGSALLGAAA